MRIPRRVPTPFSVVLAVGLLGILPKGGPTAVFADQNPKEGGSGERAGGDRGGGSTGALSGAGTSAGIGSAQGGNGSGGSDTGSGSRSSSAANPVSNRAPTELDRIRGEVGWNPERGAKLAERLAAGTADPVVRAEALTLAANASAVQVARVALDGDRGPVRKRFERRRDRAIDGQTQANGPLPANPLPGEPVVSPPDRRADVSPFSGESYRAFFSLCPSVALGTPGAWRPKTTKDLECLENRGRFLLNIRDLAEAEAVLGALQEIDGSELIPGEGDLVSRLLNMLGTAQIGRRRIEMARRSFETALEIQRQSGAAKVDRALTLNNLAAIEAIGGKFRRAQAFLNEAVTILEKAGPDHRANLVTSLDNSARMSWNLGEYQRALTLYERALALTEAEAGDGRLTLTRNLWGCARVHFALGNYSRARVLFERAQKLAESEGRKGRPILGGVLGDFSKLLVATGDLRKAQQMSERAISVLRTEFGAQDASVAAATISLASLVERRAPAQAEEAFRKTLIAAEETYGPDHPAVAYLLRDLARANRRIGRTLEAARNYRRALAIFEKSLGGEHSETALTLVLLSEVTPEAKEAVALGRRAVAALEVSLGPDHPDLAALLCHLARNEALDGRYEEAVESALRAEAITSRHLRENVRTLPQEQALQYAATRVSAVDLLLSLTLVHPTDQSIVRVWNAVLGSRALVLDELTSRRRFAPESLAADGARFAAVLTEKSRNLSNLLVRGPGSGLSSSGYLVALAGAREERDDAERVLAESVDPFRRDLERRRLGFTEIVAEIPRGAALVGYLRFNRYIWPEKGAAVADKPLTLFPTYAAFVVRGGELKASLVPLGSAPVLDAIVAEWRRQIRASPLEASDVSQSEADYLSIAARLRRMVWDPVRAKVKDSERVFIVPDGALHLLNWAALPEDDGRFLAESGPTFHYLSNERDVVSLKGKREPGRGLMVVGAPAFDDISGFASLGASSPIRVASAPSSSSAAEPRTRAGEGCGAFSGVRFGALPGTEREARGVASLWDATVAGNPEDAATVLLGAAAQEATFKASAPSRRIVHLATHGFFFDGSCGPKGATNRGVGGLVTQTSPAPAPESSAPVEALSGLALAGANNRNAARESEEDGILTADEISTMDLSRVEWAVLSGCDTGVGEVRASEGVFGIRRAFQTAGVGSLIMSLWPVGDENAEKWMLALYEARLKQGLPTADAVRAASRSLLESRRAAGASTHPAYWAPFVSAGAWQ